MNRMNLLCLLCLHLSLYNKVLCLAIAWLGVASLHFLAKVIKENALFLIFSESQTHFKLKNITFPHPTPEEIGQDIVHHGN